MLFHGVLAKNKNIAIKRFVDYFGKKKHRGMTRDFVYLYSPLDFVLRLCLQNDRVFLEMKRALMACLRIFTRSALSSRRVDDGFGFMLL